MRRVSARSSSLSPSPAVQYLHRRGSHGKIALAAVCYAVMVTWEALFSDGKSVIYDVRTNALQGFMEQTACCGKRAWPDD